MRIIISAIVVFCAGLCSAQSVSGTVLDRLGEGIPGAHVINISKGVHAHTDEQGRFMVDQIAVGDTLKATHIGFDVQYKVIDNLQEEIKFVLYQKPISLSEVVISPEINALELITSIDIKTLPVTSSQEVLRQVPGLFIGQHAGGGKAEQLFLRGFDIDHGTDVGITVDGIPVNMVSHAHGQGYADLHFVIPETIQHIGFGKGPYQADKGNFCTAGYVDFKTYDQLDQSMIKVEGGQFNTGRLVSMLRLANSSRVKAYVATEYQFTDGAFESPQNFNRINLFSKLTWQLSETERVGVLASHFTSKWDASGQVPQRAIDAGMIGRFGSIDDTEGGNTQRTNISVSFDKQFDSESHINTRAFFSYYAFDLYSNFTFFLEDSVNGDQIRQRENRNLFGLTSNYVKAFDRGWLKGNWSAGIYFRTDQSINNELTHTLNRSVVLTRYQLGDIYETNSAAFAQVNFDFGRFRINPAIRVDHFSFEYNDELVTTYKTLSDNGVMYSPKLNILFNYSPAMQWYIKAGRGFHSNDTRVVVKNSARATLPAAYGSDLGFIWKPYKNMVLNIAAWYLYLDQEFVYVGDAGVVEPSGRTQRQGIDLSARVQATNWLYFNLDANYTIARSLDDIEGENYIPLAPDLTVVGSARMQHKSGLFGSVNVRYLDGRPANEDNSITAQGYTIVDANVGYTWKRITLNVQVLNAFDTEWNETQFATESRLDGESESVEEIHFTPGTPRFVKAGVTFEF